MKRHWILGLIFMVSFLWMAGGVAAEPKGKMILGLPAEPLTFDPHKTIGGPMANMWPLVFDTLIYRDPAGKLHPGLAVSWRMIRPKVLEFKLRKGVKFSNGEPVDAHAVKFSIERIFDKRLKSRARSLFRTVDHLEVKDTHTVWLHTKSPDSYLLSPLADWGFIVPPKFYAEKDLKYLARHPVGSGPYRLAKWKKSAELVFEATPNYWAPSRQRVKTGIIKIIPDKTTRVAALLAGSVDLVKDVPPQMVSLINANSKYEAVIGPGPKACFIIMIIKKDTPWAKKEVRQAINYAVDKESISKNVLQGYGRLALGTIVGPASFGHNPNLKPYPYRPELAKKLLKEAGYADGFSVDMVVPRDRYLEGQQAAEAIAGQLKKVNVKVRVRPMEYGAWRQNTRGRWKDSKKPFWNYACRNDRPLHSAWMYSGAIHSKSGHGGVRDKKLDKLIGEARAEINQAKQLKKYQEINRIIRDEALLIFLYHLDEVAAKKKSVDWGIRATSSVILYDAGWKK